MYILGVRLFFVGLSLLCNPDQPGNHCIDQAGHYLVHTCLCLRVLRLKASATRLAWNPWFLKV